VDRRRFNRPTPPIATQFTKDNPGLAVYKPGVGATTPNRYIAWREKMKTAKREWFTIARFRAFLDEAAQIALDRKDPARPEMLKYLIDQGIGKASSKLEVETTDNTMSPKDRVHLAMVAAGSFFPARRAVRATGLGPSRSPPPRRCRAAQPR
jgi:hypothetical protein